MLNGGRSRRGKPRGPPGSRELQTALKGTRSLYLIYLFETYVGDLRVVTILFLCNRMRRSPVSGLHSAMFGVGSDDTDEPKLCPSACLAQVFTFTIKYYIIRYILNITRDVCIIHSNYFIGEGSLDHHQLVEVRIAQVVL